MSKFCTNCGKELDENAAVCVNCGVYVNNYKPKVKQPGKGLSIASMILGIVALFYGLCFTITTIAIFSSPYLFDEVEFYYNKLSTAFLFNFWPLVIAITGLSLGIASTKKIKNGFNTSGIILSSITIFICIVSIIIITFS